MRRCASALAAAGLKLKERLVAVAQSLGTRRKRGNLPRPLARLKTILDQGLAATASLWPEVQAAYTWVHRAAHILNNPEQCSRPLVQRRLGGLLGAMARHQERRSTGRKRSSGLSVVRGPVRLVAAVATRRQTFAPEQLAPRRVASWQELQATLEERRQVRTLGRRFRRDPPGYLAGLEAELIKLTLPP